MNVIREPKTPSDPPGDNNVGQIGIGENEFPAIQLYDFSVDGTVEIKYNKGGGQQQIDLVYLDDADSYADLSLDRTSYPQGASVHMVITDLQLNIDPTDEDSWTFGTAEGTTHYQLFNENGENDPSRIVDLLPDRPIISRSADPIDMSSLNFDDNGVLIFNPDTQNTLTPVLTLVDNNDQNITDATSYADARSATSDEDNQLDAGSGPVTFVETQSNSGIFKNTDEGDIANVMIADDALRGTTATIDYNDSAVSVLVKHSFGTVTFDKDAVGGVWNSGEEIPVSLVDGDFNKNSLVDEDLDLNNPEITLVPAIRIGSPITLAGSTLQIVNTDGTMIDVTEYEVDDFSDIARIDLTDHDVTNADRFDFTFADMSRDNFNAFTADETPESQFQYLNYDLRSLGDLVGDNTQISIRINDTHTDSVILDGAQGLIDISNNFGDITGTDAVIQESRLL